MSGMLDAVLVALWGLADWLTAGEAGLESLARFLASASAIFLFIASISLFMLSRSTLPELVVGVGIGLDS
jgi:hypothetical protein